VAEAVAVAVDGAAAVVVVSIVVVVVSIAEAVDGAEAMAMASTAADRVAGGMPTAFASAGTIDTGLIGEHFRMIENEM
jgi:hypothetical protein